MPSLHKIPIAILHTELLTINDDEGPIPWRWEGFKEALRFPSNCYPEEGVSKLPMTAPDFIGLADTPQTYYALSAFFKAAKENKDDKKAFTKVTTGSKANANTTGLKIYQKYFNNVLKRAKFNNFFDEVIADNEMNPWQVIKIYEMKWPEDVSNHTFK